MKVDEPDTAVGQGDALPSVEITNSFLALCDRYGSHEAAVEAVARARRAGVPGLPEHHDWPEWNPAQMRAAVEYLHGAAAAVTESAAPRRQRP